MSEMIINLNVLPETLFKLIKTKKVGVKEQDGIIQLTPIKDNFDCTIGLRGLFAAYPEMSVDNFLKRKHEDKVLDL